MKHIYIDGQALARKKDGVGSYTAHLLSGLLDKAPNEYMFYAILFKDQRNTEKLVTESANFKYIYLPFPRRLYALIVRKWFMPINRWLPTKADMVWYPNFACFPFVAKTKRVVTIHDFTYLHFPQMVSSRNLAYLRRLVPRSVSVASHLLTPSHAVANELKQQFETSLPTTVIQPIARLSDNPTAPLPKPPEGYVLFVGTLEPRKNIAGLLDAYMNLPSELRAQHKLVVAGRKGWVEQEVFARFEQYVKAGEVVWYEGPSDDELGYLYRNAGAFLFMSIYEGYGITLVEAQIGGAPVVALDTPINREATQDKATYGKDAAEVGSLLAGALAHPPAKEASIDIVDSGPERLLEIIKNELP